MDKKEDLLLCDNWLGISLLEVVGKALANIRLLQRRMHVVWGMLYIVYIVDSQYGFRSGHGCTDIWFSVYINWWRRP